MTHEFEDSLYKEIKKLKDGNSEFLIFNNVDEIKQWGDKHYSGWANSLKEKDEKYPKKHRVTFNNFSGYFGETEYESIELYSGKGYEMINNYLRGIKDGYVFDNDLMNKIIEKLDIAMETAAAADNIVVFRWLSYLKKEDLPESFHSDILAGDIIEEKGYMSTSLSYDFRPDNFGENKHILLIIRITKGIRGAYIDHISNRCDEAEFLLPRGQKLKVINVVYKSHGNIILECDLTI